jgi:hypothetical protein
MEFGSINLVVNEPDVALKTYLKIYGTNNVEQVIKLKGLNDNVDIVDGYYLKTKPVNLGIFKPRDPSSKMGEYLKKRGEGIHHICLHMGQDEFEATYLRFKEKGMKVSPKLVYIGRFSEAVFWLEEDGEQGVPIKFATKCYHGIKMWKDTIYLDTPQKFEPVEITESYDMPGIRLGTIMVTVKDWRRQPDIWADVLSMPYVQTGNLSTLEEAQVNDNRGNIFIPIKFRFNGGGAINLYCAVNDDAPINKVMAKRGQTVMYHNMCSYVIRDKTQEYWKLLDRAGFVMVDPKPLLNKESGNGNYFYFIHPISTHGVLFEIVSRYNMDKDHKMIFDWSDSTTYMVSPELNKIEL